VKRFPFAEAYARPLALESVRVALRNWRRTRKLLREGQENYRASLAHFTDMDAEERGEFKTWLYDIREQVFQAKLRVIESILRMHGQDRVAVCVNELQAEIRGCALDLGGACYIVVKGSDGSGLPQLIVIPGDRWTSKDYGNGSDWEHRIGGPYWLELEAKYEADRKAKQEAPNVDNRAFILQPPCVGLASLSVPCSGCGGMAVSVAWSACDGARRGSTSGWSASEPRNGNGQAARGNS
jgi:hypothetical protein